MGSAPNCWYHCAGYRGGIAGGITSALAPRQCQRQLAEVKAIQQAQSCPSNQTFSSNQTCSSNQTTPSNSNAPTFAAPTSNASLPITYCKMDNGEINGTTDNSIFRSAKGYTFIRYCQSDFLGSDMVGITVPSWDLCMQSCASFADQIPGIKAGLTCAGVVFVPIYSVAKTSIREIGYPANCFLKSQMPRVSISNANFEIVASLLKS